MTQSFVCSFHSFFHFTLSAFQTYGNLPDVLITKCEEKYESILKWHLHVHWKWTFVGSWRLFKTTPGSKNCFFEKKSIFYIFRWENSLDFFNLMLNRSKISTVRMLKINQKSGILAKICKFSVKEERTFFKNSQNRRYFSVILSWRTVNNQIVKNCTNLLGFLVEKYIWSKRDFSRFLMNIWLPESQQKKSRLRPCWFALRIQIVCAKPLDISQSGCRFT